MAFMQFERKHQPLAKRSTFYLRLVANLLLVLGLITVSLLVGMLGYHLLEGLAWIDAFLNASMILSGMGPVDDLHSEGAKYFAGFYAIYSGIAVIAASGLLLAPLLHRVMHRLHADDDEDEQLQNDEENRPERKSRKAASRAS